jgi:L-threonylcarbamoyladenylate synthase
MTTRITASASVAAEYILRGELVAFPTETVYGLGADVFNERAVRKIFRAKGRPHDNPLIVHIASSDQFSSLATSIPPRAGKLIEKFFPGPLTVILPKCVGVPDVVTAGLPTVAVRMPDHPVTRKFLTLCGTPVAAPSANRSGHPSPTTWPAVQDDLDGQIECILRGGRTRVGLESTVVDCTSPRPLVLRTGAISLADLRAVLPSIAVARKHPAEPARSPGTRYRHYAPEANVVIVSSPEEALITGNEAFIGITRPHKKFRKSLACRSVQSYAYELYDFFRLCDKMEVLVIYCQRVPAAGIGAAVMDRIRRAARR